METQKITGTKFCIFRVDRKFKDIKSLKGFEGHMNRTFKTLNADENRTLNNRILIGNKNIIKDAEEYIEGIKLRKNGVIARDLLLTASPEFFKGKSYGFINKWINCNVEFLKKHFGENVRFAVVHLDEMTPHIHALVIPKFKNTRGKEEYKLSNSLYFDGKEKLSEWQDLYAEHVTTSFQELHRGIKNSKARHVKISQYYTLVNADLDKENYKSVMAKAENSVLLEKQVRNLQNLLIENDKKEDNRQELLNIIKELKQDKEIYRQTIKVISEVEKVSQESITNIVKYIENKVKDNMQEDERELSKIKKSQSE